MNPFANAIVFRQSYPSRQARPEPCSRREAAICAPESGGQYKFPSALFSCVPPSACHLLCAMHVPVTRVCGGNQAMRLAPLSPPLLPTCAFSWQRFNGGAFPPGTATYAGETNDRAVAGQIPGGRVIYPHILRGASLARDGRTTPEARAPSLAAPVHLPIVLAPTSLHRPNLLHGLESWCCFGASAPPTLPQTPPKKVACDPHAHLCSLLSLPSLRDPE